MTPPLDDRPTRDERRRRTEATILSAARELFAELGFETVTIRSVAARAGVDPALVMHYFGSKQGLFAAAARWNPAHDTTADATREQLPAAALADLLATFEGPDSDREGTVALLRNCLTHPEAGRVVRDELMCQKAQTATAVLGGDDEAALRAALLGACLLGLGISRYLLEVPELAGASPEDLSRILLPALRAVTGLS